MCFKVIELLNLFFIFYSQHDYNELLEWLVSVLVLNVLILLYFSLRFLKIKLDIKFKKITELEDTAIGIVLNKIEKSTGKNKKHQWAVGQLHVPLYINI